MCPPPLPPANEKQIETHHTFERVRNRVPITDAM